MVLDEASVKKLTREVRQAIGIERTPRQVESWLLNRFRRPATALLKMLGSPDVLLEAANQMRIEYLEKSPPSSEWE